MSYLGEDGWGLGFKSENGIYYREAQPQVLSDSDLEGLYELLTFLLNQSKGRDGKSVGYIERAFFPAHRDINDLVSQCE